MHRVWVAASLSLLAFAGVATGVASQEPPDETEAQRDARMRWWREAKFGLFIHWGVYSVPAGVYKGQPVPGIGEWIMHRARIPVAEYKTFAAQFNPVKYDPEAWAELAREAGMRYIVITSKHHDGFALFDSAASDWNIAKATPYGKEVLGPLASAARKRGLKFGLYYSQAQDWTNPAGAKSGFKEGEGWDEAHKGSFDEYLRRVAVPQVREILTRYQPDILWWDTPTWMTKERADLLRPLLALRPGIITNNRLGGGYRGDTDTPEQHIPATGIPGRDWEVCMTMNDTWGYKSYDQNWKSTPDLIRKLVDIVSKGGNFLLNVGPTAEGEIPQPSIDRLREIGRWMKVNGEAIYATTASPFTRLPWGRCTAKVGPGVSTLYLHVFDWPADGRLVVPGLRNRVRAASLLAGGARLQTTQTGEEVVVHLPANAPDPVASVVKVEIDGAPDVAKVLPRQAPDGSLTLTATDADVHNVLGTDAKVESRYGAPNIGFWTDARAWVSWRVRLDRPGAFAVAAEVAAPAASSLRVVAGGKSLTAEVPATGGFDRFQEVSLGRLLLEQPGEVELQVRPEPNAWKAINLRRVILRPAAP
ncbi:MAG: alpha-L-fucosidase [Armatimonadota bacterium]|nr:alpha-L-fucosidase [Armatimonadota bacterium]